MAGSSRSARCSITELPLYMLPRLHVEESPHNSNSSQDLHDQTL